MAKLFATGPVFAFELRKASRRWQTYAGRSAIVAGQLAALGAVWLAEATARGPVAVRGQAEVGRQQGQGAVVNILPGDGILAVTHGSLRSWPV